MLFVGEAGSLKRQNVSQVAGFAAVTIAGAAIIGWWTGSPLLSSWDPGFAGVKPVAALCLAALGIALVCPGKNERFAVVFGLAVAAGAALDLGQDLVGFDFGVNRWLAPRAAMPVNGAASFRMITGTKLAMAPAGGSLALSRFEGRHFTATVLGGLAGVIAMFGLLGYLTSIHTLYSLASITPPALPNHRRSALRRRRDPFAGRNDARAPQAATVVAPADHARRRDRRPAPAVRL
jgi:hypothetical protein